MTSRSPRSRYCRSSQYSRNAGKDTVTSALEFYFQKHPKGDQEKFQKAPRIAVAQFIEAVGNKLVEDVSREDAHRWMEKAVAKEQSKGTGDLVPLSLQTLTHFCDGILLGIHKPLYAHGLLGPPCQRMLVALLGQTRVIALHAAKGPTYTCPGCGQEVVLKKGRRVIHHFAHKPPVTCSWATGETQLHLKAKEAFYEFVRAKGVLVEVEYPLADGKLRADVYLIGNNGKPIAIELQHSSITHDEIERRTSQYFAQGIALVWIPLLRPGQLTSEPGPGGRSLVVKRYTPKPFERWLHGFNFGEIWYFDPETVCLWHGRFDKSMIDVPVNEWYESGGHHVSVGGYSRISKRWRKLTLTGPFTLDAVQFTFKPREAARIGKYWYPGGTILAIKPNGK